MKHVALGLFALFFSSALWAAEPLKVEYYEVHGENMADLRKEVSERGPVGENGAHYESYTKWNVHWKFKLAPDGESCKLTSIKTTLEVTMTLPKWIKSGDMPEDLTREWDGYVTRLRLNADRHYEIGDSAAKEIERRLAGMSGTSGCKVLAEETNKQAHSIIEEFRVKERGANTELPIGQGTTCARPVYPAASLRLGEQGIVYASFLIGIDGQVIDKKIVKSSGFINLDNAVLDSIGKCRFRRAAADVATEQSWHEVKYVWKLK